MEKDDVNQATAENQVPSQAVQQEVAPVSQADASNVPTTDAQSELSLELQKEQELLDAKIAGYGSKVEIKPGFSNQVIDYSKYIGKKVKIVKVVIGTKPQYWKDGKKNATPVGIIPCFIVTADVLDKIDIGDGTIKEVKVKDAKLNAYFVTDDATGKEILSFTKDEKGIAWHFCRVLGIEDPMQAVGKYVEIEKQLNTDPNDERIWLQMRI